MFKTLLSKEILESVRTWRMIVLVAVLTIGGLVGPVLAKYTPQLIRSMAGLPPGLAELIPDPSLQDAIAQYIENITQFGTLLVVLLYMGQVAGEKERGTVAMLISKPVHRHSFLLAKWVSGLLAILIGIFLAGIGGWAYTTVLFESPSIPAFFILNVFLIIFFALYLSMTLFASTLARSQSGAAVGAFAGLALLIVWGVVPRFSEYAPSKLLGWGQAMVLGGEASAWGALVAALVLLLATFAASVWFFRREEI